MSSTPPIFPGIPIVESPIFDRLLEELDLTSTERQIAIDLNVRGYAVIDFPDNDLDMRIQRIQDYLAPMFDIDMRDPDAVKVSEKTSRVQDAWIYNKDIRAIASNQAVLELLTKLYGRRAFPFQTLNFPVGTQQPLHSDSIHFSSIPERFMCGVWLAMEDVHVDAGALTYVPGSHKWPILNNAMIGRRGFGVAEEFAQAPFQRAWDALVEGSCAMQDTFLARKGQALIWTANLLHGGSVQRDPKLTRWSQVTHYYFDDCIYYTPAFSDEPLGQLDLRVIVDVETEHMKPHTYLGEKIRTDEAPKARRSLLERFRNNKRSQQGLPSDFDRSAYYALNPDVAKARIDPADHYLSHGKAEGRRYRYR